MLMSAEPCAIVAWRMAAGQLLSSCRQGYVKVTSGGGSGAASPPPSVLFRVFLAAKPPETPGKQSLRRSLKGFDAALILPVVHVNCRWAPPSQPPLEACRRQVWADGVRHRGTPLGSRAKAACASATDLPLGCRPRESGDPSPGAPAHPVVGYGRPPARA